MTVTVMIATDGLRLPGGKAAVSGPHNGKNVDIRQHHSTKVAAVVTDSQNSYLITNPTVAFSVRSARVTETITFHSPVMSRSRVAVCLIDLFGIFSDTGTSLISALPLPLDWPVGGDCLCSDANSPCGSFYAMRSQQKVEHEAGVYPIGFPSWSNNPLVPVPLPHAVLFDDRGFGNRSLPKVQGHEAGEIGLLPLRDEVGDHYFA
jgi:hypothetical protein